MRKFKKGDVCMVVDNTYRHGFHINQLVVYDRESATNSYIFFDSRGRKNDHWYLKDEELFFVGRL